MFLHYLIQSVVYLFVFLSIHTLSNSNQSDDDLLIVDETESVTTRRGRRGNIQTTTTEETTIDPSTTTSSSTRTSNTTIYTTNAPNVDNTIYSTLYALWITPFELFDFSNNPLENDIINPKIKNLASTASDDLSNDEDMDLIVNSLDDVFVPSMIHRSFSHYAINSYYRFIYELSNNDPTTEARKQFDFILKDLDNKATINDKWFHIQKWYFNHKNESKYSSPIGSQWIYNDIFPYKSYNVFKKGLYLVIMDFLKKSNILSEELHSKIYNELFINDNLFIWATVHNDNTKGHSVHWHEESVVSGVYYTQMPVSIRMGKFKGGRLSLHDPRMGGVYPFDSRWMLEPKQGQVVLFPGYLVHHVEPIMKGLDEMEGRDGNDEVAEDDDEQHLEDRVSFAFNIEGDWDLLTDLSLTFGKKHKIKSMET